ncbi:hypothetical protein BJV78DRAFT_1278680 [Lactifluus subvellereus]|nr:hypothetical protein BJV78DRAFT_1278680 [Lactifluus subvellereus]
MPNSLGERQSASAFSLPVGRTHFDENVSTDVYRDLASRLIHNPQSDNVRVHMSSLGDGSGRTRVIIELDMVDIVLGGDQPGTSQISVAAAAQAEPSRSRAAISRPCQLAELSQAEPVQ